MRAMDLKVGMSLPAYQQNSKLGWFDITSVTVEKHRVVVHTTLKNSQTHNKFTFGHGEQVTTFDETKAKLKADIERMTAELAAMEAMK